MKIRAVLTIHSSELLPDRTIPSVTVIRFLVHFQAVQIRLVVKIHFSAIGPVLRTQPEHSTPFSALSREPLTPRVRTIRFLGIRPALTATEIETRFLDREQEAAILPGRTMRFLARSPAVRILLVRITPLSAHRPALLTQLESTTPFLEAIRDSIIQLAATHFMEWTRAFSILAELTTRSLDVDLAAEIRSAN